MADNKETPLEISTIITDYSSIAPECIVCANKDRNVKEIDELENNSFQNKGVTINQDTSTLDSLCIRCLDQDASKNNNTEIHTPSLAQSDASNTTIKTNNNCPKFPVAFEVQVDRKSNQTNLKPSQQKQNLQESFLHFMKKKKDAIKQERRHKSASLGCSVSQERLDALRYKLIEQAKRYIGVPYSKKYWSPDSPEYASPLFLDCCGLVRRVARDLQDDLGFRMGPWNQAYMYDTLPVTLTVDQLKPGDLVFMKGVYNNPKSKKQHHGMVHVEIWLGDGHRTIGSRWNSGKVGIFESYKFQPKSFHSEEYIFKSIDTWLMGVCRSFCSEHSWLQYKHNPSARSIFSSDGNIRDQRADFDDDTDTEPSCCPPPTLEHNASTAIEIISEQGSDKISVEIKPDLGAGETSLELKSELGAGETSLALKSELGAGETSLELKSELGAGETSLALKSELGAGEASLELTLELGAGEASLDLNSELGSRETSLELKSELEAGETSLDLKYELEAGENSFTLNSELSGLETRLEFDQELGLQDKDIELNRELDVQKNNLKSLTELGVRETSIVLGSELTMQENNIEFNPVFNVPENNKKLTLELRRQGSSMALKSELSTEEAIVDVKTLLVTEEDTPKHVQKKFGLASADVDKGLKSVTAELAEEDILGLGRTDCGQITTKMDLQDNACSAAGKDTPSENESPCIKELILRFEKGKKSFHRAARESVGSCRLGLQSCNVEKGGLRTRKINVPPLSTDVLTLQKMDVSSDDYKMSNENVPCSQVVNSTGLSACQCPRQNLPSKEDTVCHASWPKDFATSYKDALVSQEMSLYDSEVKSNVPGCQEVGLKNIEEILNEVPANQKALLGLDAVYDNSKAAMQESVLNDDATSHEPLFNTDVQSDISDCQKAHINVDEIPNEIPDSHGSPLSTYVSTQEKEPASQGSLLNIDVAVEEDEPASQGSLSNIYVAVKEDEPLCQVSLLNIDVAVKEDVLASQLSLLNIGVAVEEDEPASQGLLLNIDVPVKENEPACQKSLLNIDVAFKEDEPANQGSPLNIDVAVKEDEPASERSLSNIDVAVKEYEPASHGSLSNIDVAVKEDEPASERSLSNIDVAVKEDEPASHGSLLNIDVSAQEDEPACEGSLSNIDVAVKEDEPASEGSLSTIDVAVKEDEPASERSLSNIYVAVKEDKPVSEGSLSNIDVSVKEDEPARERSLSNIDVAVKEDEPACEGSLSNIDVAVKEDEPANQGSSLNIDVAVKEDELASERSLSNSGVAVKEDEPASHVLLLNIGVAIEEDEPASQRSPLNIGVAVEEDEPACQVSLLKMDNASQEDEPASHGSLLSIHVAVKEDKTVNEGSLLNIDVGAQEDEPASEGSLSIINVAVKDDEPASQGSLLNIGVAIKEDEPACQKSRLSIEVAVKEDEPACQKSLLNFDVAVKKDEPASQGSPLNIDVAVKEDELVCQESLLNIDAAAVKGDLPASQGSLSNIYVAVKEDVPASRGSLLNIDVAVKEDVPVCKGSLLNIDVAVKEDVLASNLSLLNIDVAVKEDEPASERSLLNIDVAGKEDKPASEASLSNIDVAVKEDVPASQGSLLNIDVAVKEDVLATQLSLLNIDVAVKEDVPASQGAVVNIGFSSNEDIQPHQGSHFNIDAKSEVPISLLPVSINDVTLIKKISASRGSLLNIDITSNGSVPLTQGSKFNFLDTIKEYALSNLAVNQTATLDNDVMSDINVIHNSTRKETETSLRSYNELMLQHNRFIQNMGVESNNVGGDIPVGNTSVPSLGDGRKLPSNNNAIFSYNVPTPQGSVLSSIATSSGRFQPSLGTLQSSRAILHRCLPTGRGLRVDNDVSLIDDVLGKERYILDVAQSDGLVVDERSSLYTGDGSDSLAAPESKSNTGAKVLTGAETHESASSVAILNGVESTCAETLQRNPNRSLNYAFNTSGHLQGVSAPVSFFINGDLPDYLCKCYDEAAGHTQKNRHTSAMCMAMKNRCKKNNGQPGCSTRTLRPHRGHRSGAFDPVKYAEEKGRADITLVRRTAIRDSTFSIFSNSPDSALNTSYSLRLSQIPQRGAGNSSRKGNVTQTPAGLCRLFMGWLWDVMLGLCKMLLRHFASFACFPPKLCERDDVGLDSNLMTTGVAIDDRNFAFCKTDGKQERAVCAHGPLGDRELNTFGAGPGQGINLGRLIAGEGDGRYMVGSSRPLVQKAKTIKSDFIKYTDGRTGPGALGNSNNNSSQVHDQGSSFQVDRIRVKLGDALPGTSHPLPKIKNSLPPLLINKKSLQCVKHSAASAPKKVIQVRNLPILLGHSTVRDIMTCGDTESSAQHLLSKVDSQRASCSSEKGISALSPRRQVASKLGGYTPGDSPTILNKTHCEETSANECKEGGKECTRPQSLPESSSGPWGRSRPCTIETLSEMMIGGDTEHMFNQLMEKCCAQQGVSRWPRTSNAQLEVTSCDNDEDSESDSETEDDEEDEEEDEDVDEGGSSSTDQPPWVLRTGCLDALDYVNEGETASGAVDGPEDDRKVGPSLVVKQIRMSIQGTGISHNDKKTSAPGRKAAQGKGEGAEGGESTSSKGVNEAVSKKSSDKGEGAGDDSVGRGSDDTSAGGSNGGGGKKGGVRNSKAPTCALPTNMQPTFYVSGGNNSILRGKPVRDAHGRLTNDVGSLHKKLRSRRALMPVRPRLAGVRPKLCLKPSDRANGAELLMYPRMQAYACPDRRPTFYLSHGNNSHLVEGPLLELGWKKTMDKHDERYRLKWVENRCRINYIAFREGEQLVNHIPNCKLLTNKLGLLCSLQEYERVTLLTKGRLPRLKMVDFVPETYKLDERIDRERFLNDYKEGETWICKPTSLNQGKGIFLLRSLDEINQLLSEREAKSTWSRQVQMRIVQRYIHNPLLIDGRKFDIRAYMFIASTVPFMVLFHKGYVRLSCQKYSQDDPNLTTHLTNQFVQKKDPSYKDNKEDTAWTMDKLNDYINEHIAKEKNIEKDWVFGGLMKQMQRITLHCFNSVKHKLQCKIGYFDLYGMDFMVDSDLKVWLIEINANPALWTNCQALKEAIPCVVRDALYLAIECFDKSRKGQSLLPLNSLGAYNVLYCGSTPYSGQRQVRSVSPFKDSLEICRPTGTSPVPGQRNQSPPRSVPKVNNSSPYAVYQKPEKKLSSTVLPAINIGGSVSSVPARPGLTGGAYHSTPKRYQQSLPQQQISRVSLAGSSLPEESRIRMTHASLSSSASKDDAFNRGS